MSISDLDASYVRLLRVGFLVVRQAIDARNMEWLNEECEMLHNVPSLIGETNLARHRYFWFHERQAYLDWVSAPGREHQRSRMRTFYEPIWNEMESFVTALE